MNNTLTSQTPDPKRAELLARILVKDDREALDFLHRWNVYCHTIDDMIDDAIDPVPERILGVLASAAELYSHGFYRRNAHTLLPVVLLITSEYADSIAMAGQPEAWKQRWADTLRFAGNHMILACGLIVGGYEHVRKHSEELRRDSWELHHSPDGAPQ